MPLRRGFSQEVVSDNISTLVKEGYPPSQAQAISLERARKYKKSYRKAKTRKKK